MNHFKILKYVLVLLSSYLLMGMCWAQGINGNQQLTQLLSSYQSYQANFTQTTSDQRGKVLQKSSGTVKILRPGRFRWETLRPNHQLIIANGNTLWVYDVSLAQASKQKLQQQRLSPAVLLSSSISQLSKQFTVRVAQDNWYELISKRKNDSFPFIRLHFQNNRLVALQMINALGQTNNFYFSNIEINQRLANSWFQFSPPRGVDVLG